MFRVTNVLERAMKNSYFVWALVLGCVAATAADAPSKSIKEPAKVTTKETKPDDIRVFLASKLPGAKPEDVRPTPITGVYQISLGSSTGYITADGKYMLAGDLYEIDSKTNLTEEYHTTVRVMELARIQDADTIVFAPTGLVKHTITVFTDVDCGYCRKLHSEIAELNKLGVRVRYAAYPRSGPGTDSWFKMESVWCAKDRREALTHAKLGETPHTAKCSTPVANQYQAGGRMGVNGTPAIMTSDGDYIASYMPPAQMLAKLDELHQEALSHAVSKAKAGT
jgi:thiol:disulfide interchange protein DsbC